MTDLSTSLAGGQTRPARELNNTWSCSQRNQSAAACPHGYQDDLFIERVEEVIANASRAPDTPLFLFYAPHAPHDPYEVPDAFFDKFAAIDVEVRRYYSAMINYLDGNFGRLEGALRAAGRWDNTLVIVSSDNGGPADYGLTAPIRGGNNFPLRGSKSTNWQGGVRVNAFAFGGLLDPAIAGSVTTELTAIEDWWTTFALLGGADTSDARAAAAGLPGVDGLDLRGLFLRGGNRTSPRTHVVLGDTRGDSSTGNTTVGGLVRSDGYKLLLGHVGDPVWQGPVCEWGALRGRGRVLVCLLEPHPCARRPQQDGAKACGERGLHEGLPLPPCRRPPRAARHRRRAPRHRRGAHGASGAARSNRVEPLEGHRRRPRVRCCV